MTIRLTVNDKAKAVPLVSKARHELGLFLMDRMEIVRKVPVAEGVVACDKYIKPINDELSLTYPTIVPEFYFFTTTFSEEVVAISYRLSGIGDVSHDTLTELAEALAQEGSVELSGDHLLLFTQLCKKGTT